MPVEPKRDNQGDGVHDGLDPHAAVQRQQGVDQEEKGDIQHPLSQNRADQGGPGLPHGLELDDHRIAQGHHGHCRHHAPQKRRAVLDGEGVLDEEGGEGVREQLIAYQAQQGKGQGDETAQPEGLFPPPLVAGGVVEGEKRQ